MSSSNEVSEGKRIPMPPIEIISSDGEVSLKTYTLEDAGEAFVLIDKNREFLSQYGENTPSKYPDLESFRNRILHPDPKKPGRLRFAIRNKEGVIVGSINLTPQKDDPQMGEIGYYLGEEFQHHGYVTRAIAALSDFAFRQRDYTSLFGNVHPENKPSLDALGRAGYLDSGVLNKE